MTTQSEKQIVELFCQCISDKITDQCIRQDCPCEETDCVLHNGKLVIEKKERIEKNSS